jgi:hypothetical protein
MTDKSNQGQATVITIVLSPEGEDNRASLAIKQGELGHVSSFQHSDFANLCRVLNAGLSKFVTVQENPPDDVESVANKVTPKAKLKDKSKSIKKDKPAGKPPYHLLDARGKRRELIVMTDPFDVQEKCLKNRKMVFKDLADAEHIAQLLVDAGEVTIKIVYKNGKTAKVIGKDDVQASLDVPEPSDEPSLDYPDGIDDKPQQALYDYLRDVGRVVAIYNEVQTIKKHDWTNNLMKQREVKAAIHKHIDDEAEVEAIYDILFAIDHAPEITEDGEDPSESSEEDT